MKTLWLPCTLALLLTACGEYPQTVVYEQGEFKGKADARPYDNEKYNGDKARWENDIRARGQLQNEYKRVN
jgi:starvation-inducible outer membrane lipoprotein